MSVFGLISATKGFVRIRSVEEKEIIDVTCSRKHYRWTCGVLFACSLISTATSLIGNPIDCLVGDGLRGKERVINTYCWITSTFTLPTHYNKPIGTHVPAHGIGPYVYDQDEVVYHAYYQWVPFVLFFQGTLFYLPHWIWKSWENGTIRAITNGLRGTYIEIREERNKQKKILAKYLVKSMRYHEKYATGYLMSELLNIGNVIFNIWLLNKFLGGAFLSYGMDVLKYTFDDQDIRIDPMITVFPRQTKCTFHKYGSSGTIEQHDALCILSLNVINEKVFVFLWFWLLILFVITMISLLYSFAIFLYVPLRKVILEQKYNKELPSSVAMLISKMTTGDFVLLYLLSQNLNEIIFKELLDEMGHQLYNCDEIPPPPEQKLMAVVIADSPDGDSQQNDAQETALSSPSNMPQNIHQTDTLPKTRFIDLMASFPNQNTRRLPFANSQEQENNIPLSPQSFPDLMSNFNKKFIVALSPPASFSGNELKTPNMQEQEMDGFYQPNMQASEMDISQNIDGRNKEPNFQTQDVQESTPVYPLLPPQVLTPPVMQEPKTDSTKSIHEIDTLPVKKVPGLTVNPQDLKAASPSSSGTQLSNTPNKQEAKTRIPEETNTLPNTNSQNSMINAKNPNTQELATPLPGSPTTAQNGNSSFLHKNGLRDTEM